MSFQRSWACVSTKALRDASLHSHPLEPEAGGKGGRSEALTWRSPSYPSPDL